MTHPTPGDAAPGPDRQPVRRRPNPILRVLTVGFGVFLVVLARALFGAGPAGWVLGALVGLVGVAVVVIASGLVEWWAARR